MLFWGERSMDRQSDFAEDGMIHCPCQLSVSLQFLGTDRRHEQVNCCVLLSQTTVAGNFFNVYFLSWHFISFEWNDNNVISDLIIAVVIPFFSEWAENWFSVETIIILVLQGGGRCGWRLYDCRLWTEGYYCIISSTWLHSVLLPVYSCLLQYFSDSIPFRYIGWPKRSEGRWVGGWTVRLVDIVVSYCLYIEFMVVKWKTSMFPTDSELNPIGASIIFSCFLN